MKRIILFTIGSVQEFIITARKTRDFQNASNMLSKLMLRAIQTVKKEYRGNIILPHMEHNAAEQQPSIVPNYFVASYENERPIGKQLKEILEVEYKKDMVDVVEKAVAKNDEIIEILKQQISKQLRTALDIYWCDIPDEGSGANKQAIDKLYAHMEAVKNTRQFEPHYEQEGEKCSLCGSRNAVFYKGDAPYKMQKIYIDKNNPGTYSLSIYDVIEKMKKQNPQYVYEKAKFEKEFSSEVCAIKVDKYDSFKNLLNDKERLCSVCFAKRVGCKKDHHPDEDSIRSLASFALKDWLSNKKLEKYICDQEHKSYEDFYELAYSRGVKNILSKDYSKKELEKIPEPPVYYCLYRMDIDSLGKKMRQAGENSSLLSEKLFVFLKEIINTAKYTCSGVSIIYAGGDDLMALMSAQESIRFAETVKTVFKKIFEKSEYQDLTYSQGLFFAHYKSPFSEVTRLSKEKLEGLKQRFKNAFPEKNGTVISLLTDGFSERDVFFRNNRELNISNLTELMTYFNRYSTYFHHTLGQAFLGLEDAAKLDTHIFMQMFFAEQRRLMKRSWENREDMLHLNHIEMLLHDFLRYNCISDKEIDLTNYFNLFAVIEKLNTQMEVIGDEC